jgi:hypothetical protein
MFKTREESLGGKVMADKLGPLSDGTPRDPSKMGSDSHASLYVVVFLAAIAIGVVLYWFALV